MQAYIYHVETGQIAVVITGDNNADIQREVEYQNYDTDVYGVTYNRHGLHTTYDTDYVDVCGSYE